MFAKRKRKEFPPGTFLPTPARILAILQLCMAFTLLLWVMSYPFMGKLFEVKSRTLLHEHVMHSPYFENSPEKNWVINEYEMFKKQNQPTFIVQTIESFNLLLFEVPLFEKMWILFSLILSIMALKKREGIKQAIWILPLLTLIYCIDNQRYGLLEKQHADVQLFPSEQEIIEYYLNEPFEKDILLQHKQLRQGWERYLIQKWGKEIPSNDKSIFAEQIKKAEFEFSLARLKINSLQMPNFRQVFYKKQSLPLLIIYMMWNILVAWQVSRRENRLHPKLITV